MFGTSLLSLERCLLLLSLFLVLLTLTACAKGVRIDYVGMEPDGVVVDSTSNDYEEVEKGQENFIPNRWKEWHDNYTAMACTIKEGTKICDYTLCANNGFTNGQEEPVLMGRFITNGVENRYFYSLCFFTRQSRPTKRIAAQASSPQIVTP